MSLLQVEILLAQGSGWKSEVLNRPLLEHAGVGTLLSVTVLAFSERLLFVGRAPGVGEASDNTEPAGHYQGELAIQDRHAASRLQRHLQAC